MDKRFWKGMTYRAALKRNDKVLIGNIDNEQPEYIDVSEIVTALTTDDLAQGIANLYFTVAERQKLASLPGSALSSTQIAQNYYPLNANPNGYLTSDSDLQAAKITGQLVAAVIPDLSADKITSGILGAARIPDLPASKITSGTFNADRIPNLPTSKISGLTGELSKYILNTQRGTALGVAPLDENSLIGIGYIPFLDASKINSGVFADARIPNTILRVGALDSLSSSIPKDWEPGETFTDDIETTITRYYNKRRYTLVKANVEFPFTTTDIAAEIGEGKWAVNSQDKLSQFIDDIGSTDAIVPLTVYIDLVNGNDSTALLENANKPFKTIESLFAALPVTVGETWTIVSTGGIINFQRRLPARNLIWKALSPLELNTTAIKEDDGVTDAEFVVANTVGTPGSPFWTFEGTNISIKNTFNGAKTWSQTVSTGILGIQGYIKNFEWLGERTGNLPYAFGLPTTLDINLYIENFYNVTACFYMVTPAHTNQVRLEIKNFYSSTSSQLLNGTSANKYFITIGKIIKVGSSHSNLNVLSGRGSVDIQEIEFNGVVGAFGRNVNFSNTLISNDCTLNFQGTQNISGKLTSTTYPFVNDITLEMFFSNYKGKLGQFIVNNVNDRKVNLANCDIEFNGVWIKNNKNGSKIDEPVEGVVLTGQNSFFQNDTTKNIIQSSDEQAKIPVVSNIPFYTNVKSLGENARVTYPLLNFKQKEKEITIRSKKAIVNRNDLDPELVYIIDAKLDIDTASEQIIMPEGESLSIGGYGFKISQLNNVGDGPMIVSNNGSKDLVISNLQFSSVVAGGSVFDIRDVDNLNTPSNRGNWALELETVNFSNCKSLGAVSGYRQIYGKTIGIYSVEDGLELSEKMNGVYLEGANGFNVGGTLFKAGSNLDFSSRFYLQLNCNFITGGILTDFIDANFQLTKGFQLVNGQYAINGVVDKAPNTPILIPNITAKSAKALFKSEGLLQSFEPYARLAGEDGLFYELYIDNAGTIQKRSV